MVEENQNRGCIWGSGQGPIGRDMRELSGDKNVLHLAYSLFH